MSPPLDASTVPPWSSARWRTMPRPRPRPHGRDADGDGDAADDEREHHGADVLNLPHEHGSQHTDSGKRCDDEAPELRPSVTAHA
ncbi:MAG: hypothetical protein AUH43_04525 [Acidobacteria bacterium 13_1_40CM_65_14]|nr:MAG: hypothetical protein AUH43_04525 [Acidobacteria bacterium 13_1_40CM_65_14]